MTKEQFDSLYRDKAVHCPTEELANEFLELAKEFGYGIQGVNYGEHKEKTCFNIEDDEVYYCALDWYKKKGYTIVEFKPLKVNSLLTDEEKEFLSNFEFDVLVIDEGDVNLYISGYCIHAIISGYCIHTIKLKYCKHKFNGLKPNKTYTPKELGL